VTAFAGEVWDDLVAVTVDAGLGGLECLSGIPGSVGATPVQNVGAYGAEVSRTLSRVELYDRTTGTLDWVDPASLDLAYRYSNLKFTGRDYTRSPCASP
jgi:UDP-N-acetylmuramate dehydrogenase